MENRKATITRKTNETNIKLNINLDGTGKHNIETGQGFFDHMLSLFSKHSLIDLEVKCIGDTNVDYHHSIEDIGICFGQAIKKALADKKGINRYGFFILPMDEALCRTSLDLSGRPYFIFKGSLPKESPGNFSTELVEDFFKSVSDFSAMNLHIELLYGRNSHHCLEAIFKCFAKAISTAVCREKNNNDIPSTKGII